jgi:hypothetical protein
LDGEDEGMPPDVACPGFDVVPKDSVVERMKLLLSTPPLLLSRSMSPSLLVADSFSIWAGFAVDDMLSWAGRK